MSKNVDLLSQLRPFLIITLACLKKTIHRCRNIAEILPKFGAHGSSVMSCVRKLLTSLIITTASATWGVKSLSIACHAWGLLLFHFHFSSSHPLGQALCCERLAGELKPSICQKGKSHSDAASSSRTPLVQPLSSSNYFRSRLTQKLAMFIENVIPCQSWLYWQPTVFVNIQRFSVPWDS